MILVCHCSLFQLSNIILKYLCETNDTEFADMCQGHDISNSFSVFSPAAFKCLSTSQECLRGNTDGAVTPLRQPQRASLGSWKFTRSPRA